MDRKKRVNTTSDETKSAIVNGSVALQPERPTLTAAELQKLFVSPIVNQDGYPCAIGELDRTAGETESALQEMNAETERIESESKARDNRLETDYKAADTALNARIVPIESTLDSAQQAVKNADEVLVEASQAVVTANKASEAANAISGKVDEAVELATQAKTTADNLDTDIRTKVAELVNSAPETLDTLSELAAALNNDADFAANVTTQLSNKQDKQEGKGLSSCDFTAEEKAKLARVGPSFIPKGVWDKTLSYPENAVVAFNGAAYAATVEATTIGANPRDTPGEWKAIIEPTMHNRGEYNASLQYYPGDTVTYLGSSFWCKMKTSLGIAPDLPGNGAWWQLVAKRGEDGVDGEDGYNVWLLKDTKPIPSGSDYPGVNRSDLLPDTGTPHVGDTVLGFNTDKTQMGVGQISLIIPGGSPIYVTGTQMVPFRGDQIIRYNAFTADGWTTENNILGTMYKALGMEEGQRILCVLDENDQPRGTWKGSTIYANSAFAGVAITVSVWNGNGLIGEQGEKGEPGTDPEARQMIAAETERAERAETVLGERITQEVTRATTTETDLQEQIDKFAAGNVASVNGKSGIVQLTAEDVGALSLTGGTLTGGIKAPIFQPPDATTAQQGVILVQNETLGNGTIDSAVTNLLKYIVATYKGGAYNQATFLCYGTNSWLYTAMVNVYNLQSETNELPEFSSGWLVKRGGGGDETTIPTLYVIGTANSTLYVNPVFDSSHPPVEISEKIDGTPIKMKSLPVGKAGVVVFSSESAANIAIEGSGTYNVAVLQNTSRGLTGSSITITKMSISAQTTIYAANADESSNIVVYTRIA